MTAMMDATEAYGHLATNGRAKDPGAAASLPYKSAASRSSQQPQRLLRFILLCLAAHLAQMVYQALKHQGFVATLVELTDMEHLLATVTTTTSTTSTNDGFAVDRSKLLADATQVARKATASPTIVFYNVYVPETVDGQENSIRIVREQLDQLASSYAATTGTNHSSTTTKADPLLIIYVTIGAANILTADLMNRELCAAESLTCWHAGHYANGTEELTLQLMHDYCQNPTNNKADETSLVTYLHNKGSFHRHEENENWRYHLTAAAVHEDCIRHVAAGDCNLCGLQFYSQWTPFIPGNLWTTTCQYASQLLTISGHERAVRKTVSKAVLMRLRGHISMDLFGNDRKDRFGLDRYSTEHWVGSHPDLVPCDLGGLPVVHYLTPDHTVPYSWKLGPRVHFRQAPDGIRDVAMEKTFRQETARRWKEYFFLPGNLLKWFTLYGKTPPDNSWSWNSFPDGGFWRDRAKQFGENAVDIVMSDLRRWNRFAQPLPIPPKIFFSNSSASVSRYSSKELDHGVFFDVLATEDKQKLRSQLAILNETLAGSGAKVFYLRMGSSTPKKNLCEDYTGLKCKALPILDELYVGEPQRHVFAFCQANPSARVTYLQNRLPAQLQARETLNDDLLLHTTRAVTSRECVRAKDDLGCNVCGLNFYVLPAMAMAGNMYTADCSYINQLLKPTKFVAKMSEYVAEALTLKIWGKLVNKQFPDKSEVLGLDQFAMDHWIGSGPSISPCDMYQDGLTRLMTAGNATFKLNKAPKKMDAAFDDDVEIKNAIVTRELETYRRRDLTLLPGVLLKWYMLYGEAPPPSSWVYDVYPDGDMWRTGIAEQGRQFHNDILLKYMDSGVVS